MKAFFDHPTQALNITSPMRELPLITELNPAPKLRRPPVRRQVKHPGIASAAQELGCSRQHLFLVLEGKRSSRKLAGAYAAWREMQQEVGQTVPAAVAASNPEWRKRKEHPVSDFGARLQWALRALGLRNRELAQQTASHPVSITRWMRGRVPNAVVCLAIAKAISVPFEWLVAGEGDAEVRASIAKRAGARAAERAIAAL